MIGHEYTWPPNIDAIDAAFHIRSQRGTVFAYAPTIHNPHEIWLPPFIVAHENVHIERQNADPAGWWDRYIADEEFRYEEELIAHVREYEVRRRGKDGKKYTRDALLLETTRRLMAPFYSYKLRTFEQARKDFIEHAENL